MHYLIEYFQHFQRSFRQEVSKHVFVRCKNVVVNNQTCFVSYSEHKPAISTLHSVYTRV